MNREDIMKIARKHGLPETAVEGVFIVNSDDIGRIIADERESCAKLCEDIHVEYDGEDILATWCADAIRKRAVTYD
jgi:hypothetical protein